jgi:hypothetical protein
MFNFFKEKSDKLGVTPEEFRVARKATSKVLDQVDTGGFETFMRATKELLTASKDEWEQVPPRTRMAIGGLVQGMELLVEESQKFDQLMGSLEEKE